MYLDLPDDNGNTERSRLEQLINTQKEDSVLYLEAKQKLEDDSNVPACLEHVWQVFWQLNATRGAGMNGPAPICYSEIEAYMRLTDTKLYPFEVNIIKDMDKTYLSSVNEKTKKDKK